MKFLSLLLLLSSYSFAQNILNGSFEENTFNGQYCGWDDNSYNEKMANSALIQSNSDNLMGVINKGCEFYDVNAFFEESPPDGIWYIGLFTVEYYTDSVNQGSINRGVTLKLSEPLDPNRWYRLSYYVKAFPLLSPSDEIYEELVDCTGVLTHPVIQTTRVEIGISESESAFGSGIGTSILPPQNSYQEWMQEEWIAQEIVFSPDFAAEHITCRPILPDSNQLTSRYSLFADHFVLETSTAIGETHHRLRLYPNPIKDKLHIEGEENIIIEIYDLLGHLHFSEQITKSFVNITHLPKGIYFLKAKRNGQYIHQQNIIKS